MGIGDDANKPLKKREVSDKLEEIEKRLLKIENDVAILSSLNKDMETFLCYFAGGVTGENGTLNIREIAGMSTEIEMLQNKLFEKKQESEETNRKLTEQKAVIDNLQKKQLEQESEVERLCKELEAKNDEAERIREKLEVKNAEAEKWSSELAEEKRKVKEKDEEIIAKSVEAENWNKKVEDLTDELKSKQEEADHLQDSIKEACEKNRVLKEEKKEAEHLFGKKKKELEELKTESEKLKEELEESNKEIERLNMVINNLEDEKEKEIAETNALRQDLLHEQGITRQFEDKFGCWKEETKDYQILLEAVFACNSLTVMMKDYGLSKSNGPEDVANMIHFVNLLGDGSSFLPILYVYLENYKVREREALTQDEEELFSRLNSYYRKNYGVFSDLIRYPQAGEKFDKLLMKDFDNRTKTFRFVECVYVPSIMRDENTYLMLALVKGVL